MDILTSKTNNKSKLISEIKNIRYDEVGFDELGYVEPHLNAITIFEYFLQSLDEHIISKFEKTILTATPYGTLIYIIVIGNKSIEPEFGKNEFNWITYDLETDEVISESPYKVIKFNTTKEIPSDFLLEFE